MTLPSGWKEFQDGNVLPASDINGYLQQGVLVFDDASSRDSTLVGFVREGMLAYTKDSDEITYYNGSSWNLVSGNIAFATEAARDAAIPSPTEGRYAYITGTQILYIYTSGSWVRTGIQVEANKNAQWFTGSGSVTIPVWATRVYYLVVAGGATAVAPGGFPADAAGGAGGQVVQNSTTSFTKGGTITVTVGGAGANSSIAIGGGSTITATGAGGAAAGTGKTVNGTNGTQPSAPFNIGYVGGGGGGARIENGSEVSGLSGFGGGGRGSSYDARYMPGVQGQNGDPNSGGGGGGSFAMGTGSGGSGLVGIYFS